MKQMFLIWASLLLLVVVDAARATEMASASISLQSSSGTGVNQIFNYVLTLDDIGTTDLGTFWYGWVPGQDFLKSRPTSVSNPTGWTSNITNGGSNDGFAIQFVANTPLTPGNGLDTFGFSTPDNLSTVTGLSPTHPSTLSGTSFVYIGAPLTDAGFEFVVSNASLPEPASIVGLVTLFGALAVRKPRRKRGSVAACLPEHGLRNEAGIA